MQPRHGHSWHERAPDVAQLVTRQRKRVPVESTLVQTVTDAARDDWRAAAWLLERRFPERWRRGYKAEAPPARDGLDELSDRRRARRESG